MANLLTYGFVSLQDLYTQRVNTVGVERVYSAIQASLAEYNRVVDTMTAGWVERSTIAQEYIELAGSGTLQPLTADGNPLPVVPSGQYTVGYPIHGAGTAWGTNRVTRAMLTVQEADRFTDDALQKDADWRYRHILAAIFDNVSWTFVDEVGANGAKGLGNLTVLPLANADTVVYARKGGAAAATDNHYLATADAIADLTNPFPAIRTELMEHPSNSGPYVVYVPTNLTTAIAALTEFVEMDDPDVNYQDGDNLPTAPATILGPGDEILGKLKSSNMWIVEWSRLPDNYMLAHATGAGAFLRMREYPVAELQGLFSEPFNEDDNHLGTRLLRYAGFGVFNRVAAVVQRIGNASYAVPTGFDAPLAV